MKTSELPAIYEFDPQLYPRKLWVCIGVNEEFINDKFCYNKSDKKLTFEDEDGWDALTFEEVVRKDTNLVGELVIFLSKGDMTFGTIIHECSHVVDAIEKAIGMKHGDEPSAYLLSWVGVKINDVRLGECQEISI